MITEGYITPFNMDQGRNGEAGFKFRASGDFCYDENTLNGAIHLTSDTKYEQYSDIPSGAFNWTLNGYTKGL